MTFAGQLANGFQRAMNNIGSAFYKTTGLGTSPDRGTANGNPLDPGTGYQTGQDNQDNSAPVYGYGYGYGSSGSSTADAEKAQAATQAMIDNTQTLTTRQTEQLNKNSGDNFNSYEKNFQDYKDATDKAYRKQLGQLQSSREANAKALKATQQSIERGMNLQQREMKQQSTLSALRNRLGNGALGSGLLDLAEGMARVNDAADVEELEARRQNLRNAYADYYSADSAAVDNYNTAVAQIQAAIANDDYEYAQDVANYIANYNSIYGNLDAAYWQNINSASPELAKAGLENESAASKAKEEMQTAKKNYRSAKKALAAETKAASKTGSAVAKATKKAYNEAEKAYKESKSAYKKAKNATVTVGEDTDQYTLNAYQMPDRLNLKSSVAPGASKALQKMYTPMEYVSATDPLSSAYVRGNAEARNYAPSSGTPNTRTAANQGYLDNLALLRRV